MFNCTLFCYDKTILRIENNLYNSFLTVLTILYIYYTILYIKLFYENENEEKKLKIKSQIQ